MTDDQQNELAELLNELADEIGDIIGRHPDGAFLFANVGKNSTGGDVFVEQGDVVRWYEPSIELGDILMDIWDIHNDGKTEAEGWIFLEYVVRGDTFSVSFSYNDDVEPGTNADDWRDASVKKHFGDKPVEYPPAPDWVLRIQEEERRAATARAVKD